MHISKQSSAPGTYTDLNRLNRLKVGEDRDSEANIRQVAREFESLFIGEMMKAMRSANDVLADDMFNSNASQTYRDMYDQQMAITLSEGKGIGMADVLAKQMGSMQQPKVKPNPFGQPLNEMASTAGVAADAAVQAAATGENTAVAKVDGAAQNYKAGPAGVVESTAATVAAKKYVHVADTTDIKFRRFTGVMPRSLTMARADAGQDSTPSAAANNNAQPGGVKNSIKTGAINSYNAIKNGLAQPLNKLLGRETFGTPEEFVETMLPMAQQAADRLGVDANYLVAQAALETGWGKRMQKDAAGKPSYNLFGIKSHGWKGKSGSSATTEFLNGKEVRIKDSFRRYDSFAQSFDDYVDFLHRNPRYTKALQATGDAEAYVRELQRAGYATDPQYANKISRIARQIEQQQPAQLAQARRITERS